MLQPAYTSYFSKLSSVPCIGRPSCERMRIQWSDMLRITRGCKATETLPVTPEAMTLGLAANTEEKLEQNSFGG